MRNTELISRHQLEELGKGHVPGHLPESFSLASILAERSVRHQEGLLSQNDWPKTTRKLIPST